MRRSAFAKDFIQAHFSKVRSARLIGAWCLFIIFLTVYVFLNLPDGKTHLYFFDVGQGDSVFIRTPHGQKILVDGGPDERVLDRLGEILPFYDRRLDLVVLTHFHADHITGLIEVVRRYRVGMVLANRFDYSSPEVEKFWEVIDEREILVRGLVMGEKINLGGVILECFWPPRQRVEIGSSDPNLESIVLYLTYGSFSALFTGDAENVVQQQLILLNRLPLPATIFKVPHQGAEDCCDEEFIKKLDPQLAIISVGQNRFGHPSEKTLELFESLGIEILRTDQNGTVEVVSDSKRWWYKKFPLGFRFRDERDKIRT